MKKLPFDSKRYLILENGEVFDSIKNRMVSHKNHEGYRRIRLAGKQFYLHRIIAMVHVPNPLNRKEINHKDGDKANNHASNLEWCTRSENVRHAFRTGLKNSHTGICLMAHAKNVVNLYNSGQYSMRQLAVMFGVSDPTICRLVNKQTDKYNYALL